MKMVINDKLFFITISDLTWPYFKFIVNEFDFQIGLS